MDCLVVSHKETWLDPSSPSGYSTVGGFPFQMKAISELFDTTRVFVPLRSTPLPSGAKPLIGNNLEIVSAPEPSGVDFRRKLSIIGWFFAHIKMLWREIRQADVVHAPVPGDIGTVGMLLALLQRKPLFVRHCGTWMIRETWTQRFLNWILPKIAGGRNVVMATGLGDAMPCEENPNITWVFSTSITNIEWQHLPQSVPWQPGQELHLVTVGRLEAGKNIGALLSGVKLLEREFDSYHIHIVGDGALRGELEEKVSVLEMDKKVSFYGNVTHSEVIRVLSQSHVFVFPTFGEGFSKALLEAMACGLPVISTNVSSIPYLVGQENGIILESPTPEAIAEAIAWMINHPAETASMSRSARLASEKYTLEAWRDLIGERLSDAWGVLQS